MRILQHTVDILYILCFLTREYKGAYDSILVMPNIEGSQERVDGRPLLSLSGRISSSHSCPTGFCVLFCDCIVVPMGTSSHPPNKGA